MGAGSTLLVVNGRGNVIIAAGGDGQIDVHATKRARGSDNDEARRRLANEPIEASSSGNRVEVRVESRTGNSIEADFDIKVPQDCAVDVRLASGDIHVTNVKGELRTTTASGNVALDGTTRIVAIKTVSGDIQITNGGGDGSVVLSTVSGDIMANGLTARSLDLNSISGDFRITGWAGDRVNARLLSGDFDLNGSLGKGGRSEVEAHSGDVRLVLAEQPGFEIEATTFSGNIRIDFPVKSEGPVRIGERGRGPREVRGTYGDGSASLRLQTFNGDISVIKR